MTHEETRGKVRALFNLCVFPKSITRVMSHGWHRAFVVELRVLRRPCLTAAPSGSLDPESVRGDCCVRSVFVRALVEPVLIKLAFYECPRPNSDLTLGACHVAGWA